MKKVYNNILKGMRSFGIKDYAVYEFCVFFRGLLIAKLVPEVLLAPLRVYIVLVLITSCYVWYRIGQAGK